MQKLYQRQQQQLIISQQQTQQQYQRLLKQYINQNQSLKVTLQYCLKQYNSFSEEQHIIATFDQYSPKQISKLLLKAQLNQIKTHFDQFPNHSCKLEHFLIILIQVMTIPFEEVPKYLIGLMEIFKQISSKQSQTVSYESFFNYVIGEVASLHQEQQNTEFQIHFQQLKKQDYLLHDNGIRKVYFAKDLKLYLVLDENAQVIKIYNMEMKIIARYQPAKDKHNNRSPKITYFDFNQFSNKLGISYSDCTVELINLWNFLNRPREEFQKLYLSYEIWQTQQVLVHLQFIQMTNKWLAVTQTNQVLLYDLQKLKQSKDDLVTLISLWNEPKQQLTITDILQIVPLSLICIVAGNQIFFFNQKLTEKKYKNYKHGNNIRLVKFCEQKNSFFILAEQKHLTILTVQRNSQHFKLSSYPLNHIVKDFQIFPQLDTILMTDNEHYVFLYDLSNLFCYQATLYANIAKKPHRYIRILRTSKSQFLIFQSYMLSMVQQKVALQKQVEYNIDPQAYYDSTRQQLYLSINNQILNFNILRRQLIKSYNHQNYHLPKTLSNYLIDENNKLLVLDSKMNLSHLEKRQKDGRLPVGISKNFDIEQVKMIRYNKSKNMIYFLGRDQLFEIRNNRSLNTLRQLIFQNFQFFTSQSYCQQNNSLLLTTQTHNLYLVNLDDFSVENKLLMQFPKDKSILQEVKCIKCHYLSENGVAVLLMNNNLLYLVSMKSPQQHCYLKLLEGVSYAQVDIDFRFVKMVVEEISAKDDGKVVSTSGQSKKDNNNKQKENAIRTLVYVMLATDDGHFLKIDITSHLIKLYQQCSQVNPQIDSSKIMPLQTTKHTATQTNKSKYLLNSNLIQSHKCTLKRQNYIKLFRSQCEFSKRHQKQIIVMKIIYLQKYLTLTVAKDGEIKLSQENNKTICITRLPNLAKKQWNTQDIEKIKINKIITHIKQVITKISSYLQKKKTPKQIIQTIKKNKQDDQDFRKLNHQEPIPIQIETKRIQDIVKKQMVYQIPQSELMMVNTSPSFRMHKRFVSSHKLQDGSKTFAHPWREKKSFVEMYSKLPPDNKYGKKIPNELKHLRRSLDMMPKQSKLPVQKFDLKIIPQLSMYKFEQKIIPNANPQQTSQVLNHKKENFESCYYVKSRRRMRKSNINDFDQIDKEFYKKQVSFGKRYIPKKEEKKEQEYLEAQLSKTFNFKKTKRSQNTMDYNMMPHKTNPIGSILEMFEKHNKEVAGTRYGRQIKISKELTSLRSKSFDTRY